MELTIVFGACFFVAYCVLCLGALMWVTESGWNWWHENRENQNVQTSAGFFAVLKLLPCIIVYATLMGLCAGFVCGVLAMYAMIYWIGWVGTVCVALLIDGLVTVRDERV